MTITQPVNDHKTTSKWQLNYQQMTIKWQLHDLYLNGTIIITCQVIVQATARDDVSVTTEVHLAACVVALASDLHASTRAEADDSAGFASQIPWARRLHQWVYLVQGLA